MGRMNGAGPTELRIGLFDPGMTPILRSGLGGLAAALGTLASDEFARLGAWTVEPAAVTLRWPEAGGATRFLKALFEGCFRIDRLGLIDLAGTYHRKQDIAVRAALQEALRLTFLQHGKSATKGGRPRVVSLEIDGDTHAIGVQPYKSFAHQGLWEGIGKVLDGGRQDVVDLPGWANPGAVERHVGLGATKVEYHPGEAMCAAFAIIGTMSLLASLPSSRAGVLLVPDPTDLVRFASLRPRLSPRTVAGCHVSGAGDAALTIHAALRSAELAAESNAVRGVAATLLRSTAWASQQKSRVGIVRASEFSEPTLRAFQQMVSVLPARVRVVAAKKKGEAASFFGSLSGLRWFVTENLAVGRPWFQGIAGARVGDRYVHYFASPGNLGGLWFPQDMKGLRAMIEHLSQAEETLVRSVHTALRQRFGAIWEENRTSPGAFGNRCKGEREKWRLAFAGARTSEQVRHFLADLWSRAGVVKELQAAWPTILPLLRDERWRDARDLALIALASYEGKGAEASSDAEAAAAQDEDA